MQHSSIPSFCGRTWYSIQRQLRSSCSALMLHGGIDMGISHPHPPSHMWQTSRPSSAASSSHGSVGLSPTPTIRRATEGARHTVHRQQTRPSTSSPAFATHRAPGSQIHGSSACAALVCHSCFPSHARSPRALCRASARLSLAPGVAQADGAPRAHVQLHRPS